MPNYLVVFENEITNVIVADNAEIAARVTDLEVIESTSNEPWIGWKRINGEWISPETATIEKSVQE